MTTPDRSPASAAMPRPRRNTGPARDYGIQKDGGVAGNEVPPRLVRRCKNGPSGADEVAGRAGENVEATQAILNTALPTPDTLVEANEPASPSPTEHVPPPAGSAGVPPRGPVDGLALWGAEDDGQAPPSGLRPARLDQNERLLVPFTTSMKRVPLHYCDSKACRGYLLCNEQDCLLCRIGNKPEERDLLPVYDLVDREVVVLAVSKNIRPHALRPQLHTILKRLAGGPPLMIAIRKEDTAKFVVESIPLAPEVEDGAAVIRAFRERFEAGLVDLAAAYQQLSNEELATIDEITTIMKAKGFDI